MAECAIALPETVNLDVPYLSQQDNQENPSGSCNVTSCAMVLKYLAGRVGNGDGQLEDQLYRECLDRGLSRHDPYDLQTLLRSHGIQDTFRPDAKWEDAKAHLAAGNPLICHGYFTRSGHIIVIRGYCPGGWHVNDPWGEIMFDSSDPDSRYYDKLASGENLIYSDRMMRSLAGIDSDLWLHFCSK